MKPLRWSTVLVALSAASAVVGVVRNAAAVGESVDGFPSWAERVMHEWTNRARVDPQLEMTACGAPCGEKACYSVTDPVWYSQPLNHSARFHADEMVQQGYFAHDSQCTLVSNLDALYPGGTDGSASTACVGGTKSCNPTCTAWNDRVALFGASASGEIIASPDDPDYAFYLWLFENSSSPTCAWSGSNGHRWLLLKSPGAVGFGSSGYSVGDFSGGGTPYKIPSGSHYPRQAASVEAWANWFDTAAPMAARINVDGPCSDLTLTRGTGTHGAWTTNLTGVGSGCHRYYFVFVDSASNIVTFPSTGSLGIGPEGSCADWDSSRPSMGAGCGCIPQCGGKQCGDDGCTGVCGTCSGASTCQGGQCVCTPNCSGKVCGDDGCGGTCGACSGTTTCQSGQCVCVPQCSGKVCGDDGCGSSCGSCASTDTCVSGACVAGDASTEDVAPPKDSSVADTAHDGPKADTGSKDAPGKTDGKVSDGALADGSGSHFEGGADAAEAGGPADDGGCGCSTPGSNPSSAGWLTLLALGLVARKRSRNRSRC